MQDPAEVPAGYRPEGGYGNQDIELCRPDAVGPQRIVEYGRHHPIEHANTHRQAASGDVLDSVLGSVECHVFTL